MNISTTPASTTTTSLVSASETRTPNAGFLGDVHDLYRIGMDRAIDVEKASLATFVGLNSRIVDSCKNAFWFASVFKYFLDTAAKSFSVCMEVQMSWLTMVAPHVEEMQQSYSRVDAPFSSVANTPCGRAPLASEDLSHSMDIAVGAQFTSPSDREKSSFANRNQPSPGRTVSKEIGIGLRTA